MMSLRAWLQNHPWLLERMYGATHRLFTRAAPLIRRMGYERADRMAAPLEEPAKRLLFDCRMCGQCILHSTGMTCPMTCPKNLRNGPCGGVRENGHCEVVPEMRCVWVEAFERSLVMPTYGEEIMGIQPPVNHRLQGRSAWIAMIFGVDQENPPGWPPVSTRRQSGVHAWGQSHEQ